MKSCCIVALCVVGCLSAVQAKPGVGIERDVEGSFEVMPTSQLLSEAYGKLYTLIDTFSADEALALRECLTKFALACEKRLFGDRFDIEERIERTRIEVNEFTLKELVDFVRVKDVSMLERLTEGEIEHLRSVLIKFMKDQTPDIMYYIEHGWSTIDRTVEEGSIKELLAEVVRKLYILRDNVWATKKTEFNNVIVKVIKRADEELIKCDGIKFEKLIQRMPYESLETLPVRKLVDEAYLRFQGLFACYWQDETATYKTNLVHFLKNLDEMIVKYNPRQDCLGGFGQYTAHASEWGHANQRFFCTGCMQLCAQLQRKKD